MKTYSLKPTDENAIQLLNADIIGRNQDIKQFMSLLSYMEDDCYSVAINGAWGSGKTFFIKQVKLLLDAKNQFSSMSNKTREVIERTLLSNFEVPENYITVYYDAWLNDNHSDPILSLVYEIIRTHQKDFVVEGNRSVGDIVTSLASALSGRDILTFIQKAKGTDILSPLKDIDSVRGAVKELINSIIIEHGDRLVFFIDELDRCKPDYAVRFLERIHHYFNDIRVTFVFAVNLSQLQWTVKNYYGSEFDSTRYLDRFFDLRISLKSVNHEAFLSTRLNIGQTNIFDTVCIESAKYFNFSLREIERYGRMMKIAGSAILKYSGGFSENNAIVFALGYVVPIILALQMYDIELYNKFMNGLSPDPMINILTNPNINIRINYILFSGEHYNPDNQIISLQNGQKVSSLPERLEKIYFTLFSKSLRYGYRGIDIGTMNFSYSTRNCVEEIVSMISPRSDYRLE